ncbi:SEC-C metal-binding domain-containing protein [Bacillus sp. DX1.1]|uniref:SEC-C metal-binding domain-containing protein n=1 Tax=Bacillus sp. DX1.1 TaxID=3055866 RepID=UPI00338E3065
MQFLLHSWARIQRRYIGFKKAIKDCSRPANIYENCPCNSGKKYKFCCMNKEVELDI